MLRWLLTKLLDGDSTIKTVEIPSIDDPNTRAMSLQSGDVDTAVNIGPGEIGLFQGNNKFKVDEIASLRVVLARINQKGILGDDKVRAAVISAADRKSYADVIVKRYIYSWFCSNSAIHGLRFQGLERS